MSGSQFMAWCGERTCNNAPWVIMSRDSTIVDMSHSVVTASQVPKVTWSKCSDYDCVDAQYDLGRVCPTFVSHMSDRCLYQ